MKLLTIALATGALLALVAVTARTEAGDQLFYRTITSTGNTSISLPFRATEVGYVRTSTTTCYIGYTDGLCDGTTNYEKIPGDSRGPVTGSQAIRTTQVSVWADTIPLDIQIRAKGW